MGSKLIIGIDIGGTNTKIGFVDLHGNVTFSLQIKTPILEKAQDGVLNICQELNRFQEENNIDRKNIVGIGIGIPGLLDTKTGILITSPNIPDWNNSPLKKYFQQFLSLPVSLENDANAMTMGEFYFGHGKKYSDIICLTLGTGIGGGVVVNGKLLKGADGVAGELGHITVVQDKGLRCGCGSRGCLEAYAGSIGIVKRTENALRDFPTSSLAKHYQQKKITPEIIFNYAKEEDDLARRILAETGRYLGIAIANLINIFNPECIILGGGVAGAHPFLLPEIQREIDKRAFKVPAQRATIAISKLGYEAGVLGAAGAFIAEQDMLAFSHGNQIKVLDMPLSVLALHIGALGTTAGIVTFKNDSFTLHAKTPIVAQGHNKKEIIEVAKKQTEKLLCQSGFSASNIMGTGISVAAPVKIDKKLITYPPHLNIQEINSEKAFQNTLISPLFIDNDANALALSELMYGKGRGCKNFTCLTLCTGIGAGIVILGKLYRGHGFLAGEMGHQTINHTDALSRCACGQQGCLECYASGHFIVTKMKQKIENRETKTFKGKENFTYLEVAEIANKGDEAACDIFGEMGRYLGIGISNLVKLIQPELIIISGRLSTSYALFRVTFQAELNARNITTRIEMTDFGEDADLIGAAASFLHQYLRNKGATL